MLHSNPEERPVCGTVDRGYARRVCSIRPREVDRCLRLRAATAQTTAIETRAPAGREMSHSDLSGWSPRSEQGAHDRRLPFELYRLSCATRPRPCVRGSRSCSYPLNGTTDARGGAEPRAYVPHHARRSARALESSPFGSRVRDARPRSHKRPVFSGKIVARLIIGEQRCGEALARSSRL